MIQFTWKKWMTTGVLSAGLFNLSYIMAITSPSIDAGPIYGFHIITMVASMIGSIALAIVTLFTYMDDKK